MSGAGDAVRQGGGGGDARGDYFRCLAHQPGGLEVGQAFGDRPIAASATPGILSQSETVSPARAKTMAQARPISPAPTTAMRSLPGSSRALPCDAMLPRRRLIAGGQGAI